MDKYWYFHYLVTTNDGKQTVGQNSSSIKGQIFSVCDATSQVIDYLYRINWYDGLEDNDAAAYNIHITYHAEISEEDFHDFKATYEFER